MFIMHWHCLLSLHFYVPITSTRGCSVRLHSSHKEQAGTAPLSHRRPKPADQAAPDPRLSSGSKGCCSGPTPGLLLTRQSSAHPLLPAGARASVCVCRGECSRSSAAGHRP